MKEDNKIVNRREQEESVKGLGGPKEKKEIVQMYQKCKAWILVFFI